MQSVRRLFSALLLLAALQASTGWAFEPFKVEEIRVEGLQRISIGTVFNYLPIKRGDVLTDQAASAAVRALFKTGFFKDVHLEREGNALVVFVAERPAIASIDIEGNREIPSDQLTDSLKQIGFAEGRVFDRSMLEKVTQELKRQYLSLGRYAVQIQSEVTPLERNRVAIELLIDEGEVASIRHINIVGNRAFSNEKLLGQLESGIPSPLALFSSRDQYSRQKLAADLETLRSWYLDRGYLNFNIESTQVSITPDRRDVYITINISEGEVYRIREVRLAGETILGEKILRKEIAIQPGEIFSRRKITESTTRIGNRLGDVGYAFANVNPIPDVDSEKREVSLTFFIDPGKRVYVNRINITGNRKTEDEVLRRELRQMEGAWLSTQKVKRSQTRLNRLGFFQQVNVETPVVPGTPDQVDVNIDVVESETFGSFNFGVGYGETGGFLVNASVNQENFLGTGKRFTLAFNNSKVNTVYSFSLLNPYYTLDGVSRSINLFYRTTDAAEANTANYTTDTYGGGASFGIPLSEFDRLRFGLDYEYTKINTTSSTSQSVLDFCSQAIGEGDCAFDAYKVSSRWSHDTRDRAIFPISGHDVGIGAEVAAPLSESSLSYYKLLYNHKIYWPLGERTTLTTKGEFAYGESFGDTPALPPFERYYAGGTRTVRGYKPNSLGPLDADGDPLGGDTRVVLSLALVFPPPFSPESNSVRLSAFLDGGNVYQRDLGITAEELRYSAGLAMLWLTPVGPMNFSYAQALNDKPGDETEAFQFTLGMPF